MLLMYPQMLFRCCLIPTSDVVNLFLRVLFREASCTITVSTVLEKRQHSFVLFGDAASQMVI